MDDYQKQIIAIWKYERELLKKEIKKNGINSEIENKIKLFIQRTGLEPDYLETIKERIIELDDFAISIFMKDPKKQNIYEKILEHHLKENKINVKKLNASGPGALYCQKEQISSLENKPKDLKSIDFEIKIKDGHKIYIVHKYTKEKGGAQDNQYNDVITQVRNLDSKTIKMVWFCLDGPYYTEDQLNDLRQINKNIKIVNINTIVDEIKKLK